MRNKYKFEYKNNLPLLWLISLMAFAVIQLVFNQDSKAWIVIALGAFWLLVAFGLKKLMDYNNKHQNSDET